VCEIVRLGTNEIIGTDLGDAELIQNEPLMTILCDRPSKGDDLVIEEIPDDIVFTVEDSVRAAQMAGYEFVDIDRKILPVIPHDKLFRVQFEALVKAFKQVYLK
jgi:hypothetical protein